MRPLFWWPLALVVTFGLGMAAGSVVGKRSAPSAAGTDDPRETVTRLQQEVAALQARLRSRESMAALRRGDGGGRAGGPAERPAGGRGRGADDAAGIAEGTPGPGRSAAAAPPTATAAEREARSGAPARPATVDAALERFYRWLDTSKGLEGREAGQRFRELIRDLRAMGEAGAQALLHVLTTGSDSEDRRAAARLLGALQAPQALPALRDVLEREDDLLLRRTAAAAMRRLQSPDALPIMERMLANPGEDRFVRLSAAVGLAESGRVQGVTGLAHIFEESTSDGRGRELAFRALASLKDDRPLPFMRHVLSSPVEPLYRLQAIRYLAAQGDRQSLATLQVVAQSPTEQPSIRDAAAQAHAAISGR
jgi:hypothetical protein